MKYLRKFNSLSNYNINKDSVPVPNICYVKEGNTVDEVKWRDSDYFKNEYLTTTALTDGTITFTMYAALTVANYTYAAYSLDNGTTWTQANNVASTAVTLTTPTLHAGDKVLWKGKGIRLNTTTTMTSTISIFSSTCNFDVSGNAMSILLEDNFISSTTKNTSALQGLFQGCTGLIHANNLVLYASTQTNYCYGAMFRNCSSLISAPKLDKCKSVAYCAYGNMFQNCTSLLECPNLPATALSNYAYSAMFQGCTSLRKISNINIISSSTYSLQLMFKDCTNLQIVNNINLQSVSTSGCSQMFMNCTSLVDASNITIQNGSGTYAYSEMFRTCTSLIKAPTFTGTTIGSYGFSNMFYGCTKLNDIQNQLPYTSLGTYCYNAMFYNCTGLTTAPDMAATTMNDYCCQNMYYGCINLANVPETLSAMNLATACYYQMFYNCKAMTVAPELPATTLATSCYASMFYNCTSLTSAPDLLATTVARSCYDHMFFSCSKINHVKIMALDIKDDENYRTLNDWVYAVQNNGTFVMNSAAQWYKIGISGIPKNWTIQYEGSSTTAQTYKNNLISTRTASAINDCFKTIAITSGTITLTIPSKVTATHLYSMSYSKNNGQSWTTVNNNSTTKTISVEVTAGDVVLWRGKSTGMCSQVSINNTTNNYSCFSSTCNFNVSGKLLSLLDETIMWDDIEVYDYYGYTFACLFKNCTGLISAENLILPDTNSPYGYSHMFDGCTNMTKAPTLSSPYNILTGSYEYMFQNCTSLVTSVAIGSTRVYQYGCRYMFNGCTAITSAGAINITSVSSASNNYAFHYMFGGCTHLLAAPTFAPTTIQQYSCAYMFDGCIAMTTAMTTLPATSLANYCYNYMFNGCTALTTAPLLPATTLVTGVYQGMFHNCSSLQTAPVLPATAGVNYAYRYMFQGCSSLNYIKCMLSVSGTPTAAHVQNWVKGVSSTGTFVKNSKSTKWTATGVSSIPAGWTVQTAAS